MGKITFPRFKTFNSIGMFDGVVDTVVSRLWTIKDGSTNSYFPLETTSMNLNFFMFYFKTIENFRNIKKKYPLVQASGL
jgi:hypothetical protein